MTQQNAALVEQTASASEEMANQAQELIGLMSKFKINKNHDSIRHQTITKITQSRTDDRPERRKSRPGMTLIPENQSPEAEFINDQKTGIAAVLSEEGFEEF